LTSTDVNRTLLAMNAPRRLSQRVALPILLVLSVASLVAHHSRSARLTIANVGIVLDYARTAAVFMLVCAAGMAVVGLFARALSTRLVSPALALATAFFGLECLSFGVTAGRDALSVRGLTSRTTLPWSRIAKVENEPTSVVLVDLAGQRVSLQLDALTAQQRSAFDRTLARRIWESGPPRQSE
jgi:hypothetical protein